MWLITFVQYIGVGLLCLTVISVLFDLKIAKVCMYVTLVCILVFFTLAVICTILDWLFCGKQ